VIKERTLDERLAVLGVAKSSAYGINIAASILELSTGWVRRSIKEEKRDAFPNERGVWLVPHQTLEEWYRDIFEKQEHIEAKYLSPETLAAEMRPSHVAVKMVLAKVEKDSDLDPAEKEVFRRALLRYRDEWDAEYEQRRKEERCLG